MKKMQLVGVVMLVVVALVGLTGCPGGERPWDVDKPPCPGCPDDGYALVPNIVGMTAADANAAITSATLAVGVVTEAYSPTVPAGHVISQDPAAGTSVLEGSAVDYVLSLGEQPPQCAIVPDVLGMTQADAAAAITGASLVVGTVTQAYSETVPAGHVMGQAPVGGTSVPIGSAVNIVLSLGEEPPQCAIVPNVLGMTQAEATTAITGASLVVGTVTQAYSETVPAGHVMGQAPVGGTSVPIGSAVNIVMSLGEEPPEQTTVPDVVGMEQEDAEDTIENADLVVGTVTEECSDTVCAGRVISQSPVGGTTVNVGSAVDLVISSGPCSTDCDCPFNSVVPFGGSPKDVAVAGSTITVVGNVGDQSEGFVAKFNNHGELGESWKVDASGDAFFTCISPNGEFAGGSGIYDIVAKEWVWYSLTDTVTGILSSGQACGNADGTPLYWDAAGNRYELPVSDAKCAACEGGGHASAIVIQGPDVMVYGYVWDASGHAALAFWKNGVLNAFFQDQPSMFLASASSGYYWLGGAYSLTEGGTLFAGLWRIIDGAPSANGENYGPWVAYTEDKVEGEMLRVINVDGAIDKHCSFGVGYGNNLLDDRGQPSLETGALFIGGHTYPAQDWMRSHGMPAAPAFICTAGTTTAGNCTLFVGDTNTDGRLCSVPTSWYVAK